MKLASRLIGVDLGGTKIEAAVLDEIEPVFRDVLRSLSVEPAPSQTK